MESDLLRLKHDAPMFRYVHCAVAMSPNFLHRDGDIHAVAAVDLQTPLIVLILSWVFVKLEDMVRSLRSVALAADYQG